MKNLRYTSVTTLFMLLLMSLVYACDDNQNDIASDTLVVQDVTPEEIKALQFMLEEEKLARDTYSYLGSLWSVNQFKNIKSSEQTHMDAIENLMIQNDIEYTILPPGQFKDDTLQQLYDTFVVEGTTDVVSALKIGATIEDLDIVDLQNYMDATTNPAIITVFERLQCGSRNHLKSFVFGIENNLGTYTPQYLSQDAYESILSQNRERCY